MSFMVGGFFFILFFFKVLKVLAIKICKIQPLDLLFLVFFISFYISRYHFSHVFRTSFNIIWKKDFRHKFSFFNGFTQPLHPTLPQNLLSETKVFCWCSLTYYGFSRLLCYDDTKEELEQQGRTNLTIKIIKISNSSFM